MLAEDVARDKLADFVLFCRKLNGNERKESQTFLDRLFRAFGHQGAIEAGAEFETTLAKGSKKGGTGFADLVWRSRLGTPGVVIEMKSRGEDLSKHYAQVERYWMRIAPNRPRYAMLSNFDEFWVFDFENQVDEPVERLRIDETLPYRATALSFLQLGGSKPVFNNNQVEVTERNARRMGELYQTLYERGRRQQFRDFSEEQLQSFVLQCVMAMFAEDRGLLPRDLFVSLVQDCQAGGSAYDLLGGLFREMNQRGVTRAGRYKGVQYFNGGLFANVEPIELTPEELKFLDICARENWSNVRPSIFGNIFEGAIDPVKRHAHGIHFTSEVDIRQIVRPTISDYWEERINAANTIGELNGLQMEIQRYRVLDPACGSGNFLYVAYQEMKRLEKLLIDKVAERRRSEAGQMQMGYVTPLQFFGMDTNPFAVKLARVTMMIARKIAIDKYAMDEPVLPLDTLDCNIVCQDALFSDWPRADAIIGNPPFLGKRNVRRDIGDEYVNCLFEQFPQAKGVDLCTHWFRLAHDHIQNDGRIGMVGTNSISQGKSRKASLDYIIQNGGYIHEAISTQPWSGEAAVHVSIVNWSKQLPKIRHLDHREVSSINSSLTVTLDVSQAHRLKINQNLCFQSCLLVGKGFIISEQEAQKWIVEDPKNREVLKPMIDGKSLTRPFESHDWVIDFNAMPLEEASLYQKPFQRVREVVKPDRDINRDKQARTHWWRFLRSRPEMRTALAPPQGISCYFTAPQVSKLAIFIPVDIDILPCEAIMVIASDDFYTLGIITSNVHRSWVKAQCSTLKGDTRYTNTTCFETFPFPQAPTATLVEKIRCTMQELHQYRSETMEKRQWGITQLYNQFFNEPTSQLHKLYAQLDALVLQAYKFSPSDDLLAKLLALNLELANREEQGLAVVGPYAPTVKS